MGQWVVLTTSILKAKLWLAVPTRWLGTSAIRRILQQGRLLASDGTPPICLSRGWYNRWSRHGHQFSFRHLQHTSTNKQNFFFGKLARGLWMASICLQNCVKTIDVVVSSFAILLFFHKNQKAFPGMILKEGNTLTTTMCIIYTVYYSTPEQPCLTK